MKDDNLKIMMEQFIIKDGKVYVEVIVPRELAATTKERRFFEKNPGLKRRFAYTFNIDKYLPEELFMILKRKIDANFWYLNEEDIQLDKKTINLIKENIDYFEYCGGDIVQLLKKIKIIASQRTFCLPYKEKRIITYQDIKDGLEIHKQRYKELEKKNFSHQMMYI